MHPVQGLQWKPCTFCRACFRLQGITAPSSISLKKNRQMPCSIFQSFPRQYSAGGINIEVRNTAGNALTSTSSERSPLFSEARTKYKARSVGRHGERQHFQQRLGRCSSSTAYVHKYSRVRMFNVKNYAYYRAQAVVRDTYLCSNPYPTYCKKYPRLIRSSVSPKKGVQFSRGLVKDCSLREK